MTSLDATTRMDVVPALAAPRAQLLLVLGDDDLVSGHRASHWTGVAPAIELDLAFATISQDGVNHADLWYQLLVTDEPASGDPAVRRAVDAIGLGRPADAYRHAILCERPPRDIAFSLARHIVVDHVVATRLAVLVDSTDAAIAELATRIAWEQRYHLQHADHWLERLASATDDERLRLADAMAVVVAEAQGLFEPFVGEDEVVADGTLPVDHREIRRRWVATMEPLLEPIGMSGLLTVDQAPPEASGGRCGRHSTDFTEDMHPEMTALYQSDPEATW